MPRRRNSIIIDPGARALRAIETRWVGNVLHIERAVSAAVPDEIDSADSEQYGSWIAAQLKDARISRGPAVWLLPRQQVAIKRLTLPTTDTDELPEMARLAMQRDLPFDGTAAVIDFQPLETLEHSTKIAAVAAAADAVQHTRDLARRTPYRMERLALRVSAAPLLIDAEPHDDAAASLVIDITGESVEISIIASGAIRVSRAAELPNTDDQDQIVETVMTETRRTWMAWRMMEDSIEVRQVWVLGLPGPAATVAEKAGEMLHVPAAVQTAHPQVDAGNVAEQVSRSIPLLQQISRSTLLPLAAVLLEGRQSDANEIIDLAHPSRPPDLAARRRQRLLVAAGGLVVLCFGAWTFAQRELSGLDARIGRMEQRLQEHAPEARRSLRDAYKLAHLEEWERVHVDWLDHLHRLASFTPPQQRTLVLDGWSGRLDFRGIRYLREKNPDTDSHWDAPAEITIVVDGEATDRATADQFRDVLVNSELYRLRSAGADRPGGRRLSFPFTWRLSTDPLAIAWTVEPEAGGDEDDDHESSSAGKKQGANSDVSARTFNTETQKTTNPICVHPCSSVVSTSFYKYRIPTPWPSVALRGELQHSPQQRGAGSGRS